MPCFAEPPTTYCSLAMDPYQSSSNPTSTQQSLSATTDPSLYYDYRQQPAGAPMPASGYGAQQYAYQHSAPQYAGMNVTEQHSLRSPQYQGSMGHVSGQYGGAYPEQGQTLRNMPFSSAYPAGYHSGHGGAPSGMQRGASPAPHSPYGGQQYAPAAASTYGATAHHRHSPQSTRYIPTPAQTIQLQNMSSRGAAASNNIVIPPSSSPSPGVERYPCDKCDRTFSRPHDRKRHYESQHMMTSHMCKYCQKEFSRADSLKRHLDNGCDKMPAP
ncbi:hypothetical protein WOLCODRAFT_166606 [Wolfiporia cocos MD-104 SS10]|uniref:C2H2-type domain-containing protein n=1 Tax=Wolfiporia cocos (strain MD-104) TaxID=742152 RepID=A0A2H3J2R9_WOLCO|nr:hypothetical protein WOLCODRAFT_166606 [Wolfiporia cocos MD-104 SS10]